MKHGDRSASRAARRRPAGGAVRGAGADLPAWAAGAARAPRSTRRAARRRPGPGHAPKLDALAATAALRARAIAARHPRRVVNATGVVLHTNLGRAVMARGAGEAALEAATYYGDLELDPATGRRGDRLGALGRKLGVARWLRGRVRSQQQRGSAAAGGRDAGARSRGRSFRAANCVEIGGSFRLPDILDAAGVRLVEVGTTNRTHPDDYRRALRPETAIAAEGAPQQLRAARLRRGGGDRARSRRSRATLVFRCSRISAVAR